MPATGTSSKACLPLLWFEAANGGRQLKVTVSLSAYWSGWCSVLGVSRWWYGCLAVVVVEVVFVFCVSPVFFLVPANISECFALFCSVRQTTTVCACKQTKDTKPQTHHSQATQSVSDSTETPRRRATQCHGKHITWHKS